MLTIGVFDGVHLGHQHLIEQLVLKGREFGLPAVAMTFQPDPAAYFCADRGISLMSWRERILALSATGVDHVACLPFDRNVSGMRAREFVEDLLVRQLGVRFLKIGDDFRFGEGREGNYETLVHLGQEHGFDVNETATCEVDGKRVSSTWIRHCLAEGDLESAERLLGRPYQMCGRVIRGEKLGRRLGFPTANIALRRKRVAMTGVYAVHADLPSGESVAGVANLGVRPAVNRLDTPLLEVHLLDFDADLYDQSIQVNFEKRLRDERDFDGLESLQTAIAEDIKMARDWFASKD